MRSFYSKGIASARLFKNLDSNLRVTTNGTILYQVHQLLIKLYSYALDWIKIRQLLVRGMFGNKDSISHSGL